ncbi:radical SAM protein [Oceanidesulfovibrio indonesiensis]|uniref:Radical SAM protein n=1 Tax=Oceanidesulfovibrio indonesiensis TaxID=54767 RepID=A0A7M3MI86_9BACT|nr:radical SAM protein [Oceanidesulfovibrio indonesiensis]TVM18903.1 radical SAM protein [Oceanidesulfovibrio indonesiensis]
MPFQYIFGPVASSRLGRSLGLDLLGSKICTFDCLYCEVGPTRRLTLERRPYVPASEILTELKAWNQQNQGLSLDHVTLGGSGEPTLNSEMPAIIAGAREILPGVPVAVLTNSTLMTDPTVRAELAKADAVLPSLDSLRWEPLASLNRPNPRLIAGGQKAVDELAESLVTFRKQFHGRLYLEIFLALGVNDSDEDLALFREYVPRLAPDRVDVVTLSRPGAYAEAHPATPETLKHWRDALCPFCAAPAGQDNAGPRPGTAPDRKTAPVQGADPITVLEAVRASLARRPQTASQLADALDVSRTTVVSALESLEKQGHITRRTDQNGEPLYGVLR